MRIRPVDLEPVYYKCKHCCVIETTEPLKRVPFYYVTTTGRIAMRFNYLCTECKGEMVEIPSF